VIYHEQAQEERRITSQLSVARDVLAHTITDGAQNIAPKRALNKLQIGREEFTA
jgi:hypothetical protein